MPRFGPESFRIKDGRQLLLRHCETKDAPGFAPFAAQIARESQQTHQYVGRIPPTVEALAQVWSHAAEGSDRLYLGVFDDGTLVGQLIFLKPEPDHPWLKHNASFGLMILQAYWGNGIARRMLKIAEEVSPSMGVTRIEALVRTDNERGLKLYQSAGYQIEGTRRKASRIDGHYVDNYFIAKLL